MKSIFLSIIVLAVILSSCSSCEIAMHQCPPDTYMIGIVKDSDKAYSVYAVNYLLNRQKMLSVLAKFDSCTSVELRSKVGTIREKLDQENDALKTWFTHAIAELQKDPCSNSALPLLEVGSERINNYTLDAEALNESTDVKRPIKLSDTTLFIDMFTRYLTHSLRQTLNDLVVNRLDALKSIGTAIVQNRTDMLSRDSNLFVNRMDSLERNIINAIGSNRSYLIGEVYFNLYNKKLRPEGKQYLKNLVRFLSIEKRGQLLVVGHADDQRIIEGSQPFENNMELSNARANEVERYLIDTLNVDPSHVHISAYGDKYPVAPNDSTNQERNRRAEIILFPCPER